MCGKRTIAMSQETLTDAIVSIFDLIKDGVTGMIIPKGHKGIASTDNRLDAMLQGVINEAIDEKL